MFRRLEFYLIVVKSTILILSSKNASLTLSLVLDESILMFFNDFLFVNFNDAKSSIVSIC